MPSNLHTTLLTELAELAKIAVVGTLSEAYRTCGTPGCRCHAGGPKHGPHLQLVYRGVTGRTTSAYVPMAAHSAIREGVAAWQALQTRLRELAEQNRAQILQRARNERSRAAQERANVGATEAGRSSPTGKRKNFSPAVGDQAKRGR